jgi:predicted RNA-binding protein with PUA domain
MGCPYENYSGENCHKDFCECVREALKEQRKKSKERKVNGSSNFFVNNKIPYETTTIENIVTTEYWGIKYYVSLKSFSFRKEGTKNWLVKKKKLFKITNSLTFGKYKGSKIKDIIENDKKYIIWLVNQSDYLFDIDIHNAINT